jgi:hypothetical protein
MEGASDVSEAPTFSTFRAGSSRYIRTVNYFFSWFYSVLTGEFWDSTFYPADEQGFASKRRKILQILH